jgi:integrase
MRERLTPAFIAKPPIPAAGRTIYWDVAMPGFGLMVTRNGHKTFVVDYRAAGRKRRLHLKSGLTLSDARREAKAVLGKVAKGGDPLTERRKAERAKSETLKAIVEEYFDREGKKLRSAGYRLAAFERLIFPVLGDRQIESIKRSEIVRLLDKIEDERGPSMAHLALAFLSKVFNWHASRDDDFLSPIRRGMGRIKLGEHARERVLADDELRAVWQAAEGMSGPFGHYVRFLLLTATRRNEAANMVREEMLPDGDWIIPAARMKGKQEHVVPLSAAARVIIDAMPNFSSYVFTTNGRTPIGGFTRYRATLNAVVLAELRKLDPEAKPLPNWTIHDLRRTARSLLSRAGINADIAERCLAHTIGGVRGVYDRYAYHAEKKHAFEALAAQVERIVHPASNVASLDERRTASKGISRVPG